MEWLKKNKIIITATIVVVVVLVTLEFLFNPINQATSSPTAKINGQTITLEIADTLAKRIQGLSNRASLPTGHGMLFIFEDYKRQTFWMKDMQFNIDIIWIKDNTVVGLVADAQAPKGKIIEKYSSEEPVNFVLELNSGAASQYNIWPGDKIKLNFN